VAREIYSQGFIIYDNGDNPYNIKANHLATVESTYLHVEKQSSYVNLNGYNLRAERFYSDSRLPLTTLDDYSKICVTLDSGSILSLQNHNFYVSFGFPAKGTSVTSGNNIIKTSINWNYNLLTDAVYRTVINGKRTVEFSISNFTNLSQYASCCSLYGQPFIYITEYSAYQEGEDYEEYKTEAMSIYKIWLE